MQLHISEMARIKSQNAIFISGCARSGTTILGKVVHTLNGVEYAHEPPSVLSLISVINKLPEDQWKLLFETYLYEDFLIDAICGRNINCNRSDNSSIWQVKSLEDVESRLQHSMRKVDAEKLATSRQIALKLPDIIPFLPSLKKYYPDMKMVIIKRDAVGTLTSMLDKQWFADENLQQNSIWPFFKNDYVKIPYWVESEDCEMWKELNELDRCAYYYLQMNRNCDLISDHIEVRYTALLADPNKEIEKLSSMLGLNYGPRTQEVIDSIMPTKKDRNVDLLKNISKKFRDEVEHYSSKYS